MKFKPYWERLTPDGKRALATVLGTSVAYLSQLAHGHRQPSFLTVDRIAGATGGIVGRDSWPLRVPA